MTMTHAESARLSHISRAQLDKEITEFFEAARPKILEQRKENGYHYTRFDAAYAEGAKSREYCKPTGRNGAYDL